MMMAMYLQYAKTKSKGKASRKVWGDVLSHPESFSYQDISR